MKQYKILLKVRNMIKNGEISWNDVPAHLEEMGYKDLIHFFWCKEV